MVLSRYLMTCLLGLGIVSTGEAHASSAKTSFKKKKFVSPDVVKESL